MASKTKTRQVTITEEGGTFSTFFRRLAGEKSEYDFEGLSSLRNLLSNEKARIINVLKNKKPNSVYHLARILGRNFKSVYDDIKLLENFGFIDLIAEKTGKRERLRPVIVVDSLNIEIRL